MHLGHVTRLAEAHSPLFRVSVATVVFVGFNNQQDSLQTFGEERLGLKS